MLKITIKSKGLDIEQLSKYYMIAFLSLNSAQKRVVSQSTINGDIKEDHFVLELNDVPIMRSISTMICERMIERDDKFIVAEVRDKDHQLFCSNIKDSEETVDTVVKTIEPKASPPLQDKGLEEAIKPVKDEIEEVSEPLETSEDDEDLLSYLDGKAWDIKKLILASDLSIDSLQFILVHEEATKNRITVKSAIESRILDVHDLSTILSMSVWNIKKQIDQDQLPKFVLVELLDEEVNNKNRKSLVPFLKDLIKGIEEEMNNQVEE